LDGTLVLSPDPSPTMARDLSFTPSLAERYFRVEAIKPLAP
jgi:hypothetical protein